MIYLYRILNYFLVMITLEYNFVQGFFSSIPRIISGVIFKFRIVFDKEALYRVWDFDIWDSSIVPRLSPFNHHSSIIIHIGTASYHKNSIFFSKLALFCFQEVRIFLRQISSIRNFHLTLFNECVFRSNEVSIFFFKKRKIH